MIQARLLQRSCHPLKNGYRQANNAPRIGRNFSSLGSIHTTLNLRVAKTDLVPPRTVSRYQQWHLLPLNGPTLARFASTNVSASPVADIQPEFASPSTTPTLSDKHLYPESLDDVASYDPAPVYEHVGFLKEMGLDFGWGTTAMMETLLELVHLNAGTPWWASIALSLVIVRLVLLKAYFGAADTAARNQLIAEYNEPIMARMKAAQRNQDQVGLSKALKEMSDLRARAGVKYWKLFVPFIQVPIGFGFFRLVRRMSQLPVPGLDTGGLLWMQDLTLSDPYFVLPTLTAAFYWYTFKVGGETGTSNAVMSPALKKVFLYVLPPFSGLIMCAWPGALQITFFVQALISLIQSAALRQDWFRNMVGIQPLPRPGDIRPMTSDSARTITVQGTSAAKKGIIGGAVEDIKTAFSSAKKRAVDYQQQKNTKSGRLTPAELKHAQAYEARRKREIAQQRFEKGQLKEEQRKRRR